MPVRKCKKEVTHREYLDWQVRFRGEWNEPSRTDHYLMLIAHRVQHVLSPRAKLDLKPQKLTFFFKRTSLVGRTKEAILKQSKAAWFGALGIKREK